MEDGEIVQAEHDEGGGYLFISGHLLMPAEDRHRLGHDQEDVFADIRRRFPRSDYEAECDHQTRASQDTKQSLDPASCVGENDIDLFPIPGDIDPKRIPGIVDMLREKGYRAFPNHVLVAGSHPKPFPASPPRPASPGLKSFTPNAGSPGRGVRVAVIDGGCDLRNQWLGNADIRPRPARGAGASPDQETVHASLTTTPLPRYAGHGTFVTGIVLQHAPGAAILPRKVFAGDGQMTDRDLRDAIRDVSTLADVISISCGGPTHDGLGLPATEEALNELFAQRPEVAVVASAGNDSVDVPYFPAAAKRVIGVAALGADGRRASFSNFGSWVTACAPGFEAKSTFLEYSGLLERYAHVSGDGDHDDHDHDHDDHDHDQGHHAVPADAVPPTFPGWAHWSGTSFAAPRVAGAIAETMVRLGIRSAAQAASVLLSGQPVFVDRGKPLGVVLVPPVFLH